MAPTIKKLTTTPKWKFVFQILFLGVVSHVPMAMAQSPGTFTPTGNLPTPFPWSATPLPNGKVLFLTDGNGNTGQVAANELYDPGTGTFTATGDRKTYGGSTATLLPNGKVLIAGTWTMGADGRSSLGHAELYDPDTDRFAPTGDMTAARAGGTATLLNNGRVLIAGGWVIVGGSERESASAELYDPSTGTFAATGDMHEPLCETATLLPNGKVLVTRSYVFDFAQFRVNLVRHAELYDASTGTFTFTGNMTTDHSGLPTATLLTNGKVLVAGGANGDCLDDDCLPSAFADLYDPATGIFTATGNMTEARGGHTATLLPNGRVLITGGEGTGGASAEIYDPGTGIFSAAGTMSVGRRYHTATLLNGGKVLIAGGYGLASAELYIPTVLVPAPVLFSVSGDGRGQGAIWHASTGQVASPGSPAVAGEVLSMYTTSLADDSVIPPQVTVGGQLAEVLYFGAAPGYAGYYQVNIRVPSGVAPGPAVPVRLTYIGRSSNTVTIGSPLSAPLRSISVTTVRNAASNLSGPVAAGEMVVVDGFGLGPSQFTSSAAGSDDLSGTQLAGTTVQINGTPATLIYTGATQVAAIVPDSVLGDTAQFTVTYQGQTSASFPVPVAPAAPGIFTADSTGQGHAASINQNGLINTPGHWGDVLTLFVTGTGKAASAVTIHGFNLSVDPLFVGKGPVPGVMQIQVPIPMGQDCDTQVVVQVGDATSQPGVTIAIDICI